MANATGTDYRLVLSEAVTAAKLGQKSLARKILQDLVEKDPRNERAWLWLAALYEDQTEAYAALNRVLDINPNNEQALKALALARLQEGAERYKQPCAPAPARARHVPAPVTPVRPAGQVVWHCPLCAAGAEGPERRCHRCGAIVSLAQANEYAENKGVNEELLFEAMQRLQDRIANEETWQDRLYMAYSLLNLNRAAEALPHLRAAGRISGHAPGLDYLAESLASRRLILTVDDSVTLRKIVSITLERQGYRVLTATDGMQALAKLNEETPDLVLLDITMPRMDGYQVCKVIKQNPFTRHIPVVMLSGKDGFFDKVKGKLAGATDYITKPFKEAALLAAVEKYIASRKGRKA